jgi:prepilin-type processing-associated H-X9-DG protein
MGLPREDDVLAASGNMPLLLDCVCPEGAPSIIDEPPVYDGALIPNDRGYISGAQRVCINRHNGAINSVFLDGCVRRVGLKEIWTLKWSPDRRTNGPWTRAGGVQPSDWPPWMRRFRDY